MKAENSIRVLISPLNWGLGHASRCVPIIETLLQHGYEVIVCAEKKQASLLKGEFPSIQILQMANNEIKYAHGSSSFLKILVQIPSFLSGIVREHRALKKYQKIYQPQLIISDNRYGFFLKDVPSIFMTHQISPRLPYPIRFAENLTAKLQRLFINNFALCMIPDSESEYNLSGLLSHGKILPRNTKYIGVLSRMKPQNNADIEKKYDVCAILSGPEPQRSILESILINQLKNNNLKAIIIRGLPDSAEKIEFGIEFRAHVPTSVMQTIINQSHTIVMRAGYSSIMDFVALGKTAIIVPTPGQSEQKYLAEYLSKSGFFVSMTQHNFDLRSGIEQLARLKSRQIQTKRFNGIKFIEMIKIQFRL